jgi:Domain of unknown function (DUF222)
MCMGRGVRQLAGEMRLLHRQIAQLQARLVSCVGEFDTAQGYELDEYRSTASWLRCELRIHPREACQLVGMARQLRQLPAVEQAFAGGEISHAHAAVIARTARQVGVEHVAASEQVLLDLATTSNPKQLSIATQHLRYCVDPDGAGRDAVKAYEKRELSVARTIDDMVAINGMLDPHSGATVLAALDALTPPPRDDDPRTAGQRRADALTELCRRALDGGELPQVNGEKPHLLVTIPYDTLVANLGSADLRWTGPISATDARLLACDCAVIPAVLGSTGEVLDIGRKSRIWPIAIRRAIELRDQTCRHIDCDAPAQYCDVHHKKHWADGGPTNTTNGILTCRRHHTGIHKYGAAFRSDGRFTIMRH